jgi:ribonuclease P protein component
MALPQRHRLRGQKVFDRIYREGRRIHGSLMVLRVMAADPSLLRPSEQRHPPSAWRCGIVVSGKVSKRAVQRNRIRRLLHHHLLHQLLDQAESLTQPGNPPGNQGSPQWLLISLKPGGAESDSERLLGECNDLLRKAGLLP